MIKIPSQPKTLNLRIQVPATLLAPPTPPPCEFIPASEAPLEVMPRSLAHRIGEGAAKAVGALAGAPVGVLAAYGSMGVGAAMGGLGALGGVLMMVLADDPKIKVLGGLMALGAIALGGVIGTAAVGVAAAASVYYFARAGAHVAGSIFNGK